jgi:hypothetical protein
LEPPAELRAFIQERIAAIKEGAPGDLSEDGSALFVHGGPMYECFISPDGDLFIETLDWADGRVQLDRSRRAQIETLVLGALNYPILANFVPLRPPDAATCETCSGKGLVRLENGNSKTWHGSKTWPGSLCRPCSGLGWVSASVFQEPLASD